VFVSFGGEGSTGTC